MLNYIGNDDLYQGQIWFLLRFEIRPKYLKYFITTYWMNFVAQAQISFKLPAIQEEEPVTVIDYVWLHRDHVYKKAYLMFLNQPKSDL